MKTRPPWDQVITITSVPASKACRANSTTPWCPSDEIMTFHLQKKLISGIIVSKCTTGFGAPCI